MTVPTPIPVLSAEEWDAKIKAKLPLIPVWCRQPSDERLRELREAIEKGAIKPLGLRYVTEKELLYGEGDWNAIAADVPLSERGFGT